MTKLDEVSLFYKILKKIIDLHIKKFSEKDWIKFSFSAKLVKKL